MSNVSATAMVCISVLVLAGTGCDSGDGAPSGPNQTELVCPHAQDQQSPAADNPQYRVISPNGGERFRIGETITVKTTSKEMGEANLRLLVNGYNVQAPEVFGSFFTQEDTIHTFVVPATISVPDPDNPGQTKTVSTVSDSCLIQLIDYQIAEYYDYSDCYFSITN